MSSPYPITPANVSQFEWLVILGGVACFAMAWGVGANDVANCFGTSVGAKAITLKQAVIIASIFEFLGALILGAGVTNTVRSGITDFTYFEGEEDLLMVGMFASLISAALWLFFATKWALPVSTTQSIVGSIIGFTIVEKGPDAIYWHNVYQILIWWFATPITAAVLVIILFVPLRNYLLRRPSDSYKMALTWWPFFVFLVLFVMTIFLLEKGVHFMNVEISMGIAVVIAAVIGAICAGLAYYIFINTGLVHRFVQRRCKAELLKTSPKKSEMTKQNKNELSIVAANKNEQAWDGDYGSVAVHDVDQTNINMEEDLSLNSEPNAVKDNLLHGLNVDILADLSKKEEKIRNESEKFDPQVEESFAWLQVLTATFAIVAHGSNDVANAVAPFAAMIGIFRDGLVSANVDVDWWVLAMGGAGMSLGLATFGYKVIKALGARMAAMSCTRGYCIQLSSATTIILASYYGQPASSTHAQVGATVGCGLMELLNPNSKLKLHDVVNWTLLLQIFFGWIMTLLVSGLTTAGIFSLLAYSPAHHSVCDG